MSQLFREEAKDIFRIFVPFESVYTSVFLIKSRKLLIDCGTYASDIDEYVIPALTEIGVSLDDIQYILLTHSHTDHSGGLNTLLQKSFANVKVITATENRGCILKDIEIIELKGHSEDSIGVIECKTNSLISGDAIQLYGIGRFGCGVANGKEYLETLDKLSRCNFENIFAAHNYAFLGERAVGKKQVDKYISEAKKNYLEIVAYVKEKVSQGINDIIQIQTDFLRDFQGYPKPQTFAIQDIIDNL